jgi:hypothetical protein
MPGKNIRQCKDRWTNYLAPALNNAVWTCEEDIRLIQKHTELGPRWVQIAAFFPNRTDSMIKNRFNKLQRREQSRRELLRQGQLLCAVPVVQSMPMLATSPPADRVPFPVMETSQNAAAIQEERDFWDDSFGFVDEMFDL